MIVVPAPLSRPEAGTDPFASATTCRSLRATRSRNAWFARLQVRAAVLGVCCLAMTGALVAEEFVDGPGGVPAAVSAPRSAEAPGHARLEADPVRCEAGPGEAARSEFILTEFKAEESRAAGGKAPAADKAEKDIASFKGTSATSARKAALGALPLDLLAPEQRRRVEEVTSSASYFRRLPAVAFAVEPEVYTFFIQHPDVAVSIWRAMKISQLQLWQTSKSMYEADCGDGTIGTIEVLYRGVDRHLVLCEGVYKTSFLTKPVKARSLLQLQLGFFREADGTVYVTHRADLFVSFPSQTVEAVAKILSPLTAAMADRTFCEVSLFIKMMSLAMTRRPDWVEETIQKMDGIPEARRDQLMELTALVFATAHRKALERAREGRQHQEEIGGAELEAALRPKNTPRAPTDNAVPAAPPAAPLPRLSGNAPAGRQRE